MMLAIPLFSSNLGAAVSQVAARVRASVTEIHSRGGTGSGTIWRADGTIVTNHHVTPGEGARVVLEDGRVLQARAVSHDSRNDLAVLKVDADELPAALLGDARSLRAGDLVLAVGNPAGLRGAVTVGVVHRALPRSHPGRRRELIEADVLLGPGSSGGPLADARGRVVGINAMAGNGMALAVPTHVVERLVGRAGGEAPRLGIAAQEVALPDKDRASAMLVMRVEPHSAAERAGLLLGDLLLSVDGHDLEGGAGLLNALDAAGGQGTGPLRLAVRRGGAPRDVLIDWGGRASAALEGALVPQPTPAPVPALAAA